MSTAFNRFPTYQEPIETNEVTTRGWYSFWAGLFSGQPTAPVSAISVGASPFSYTATVGGSVVINAGTVSQVQVSRDGLTFFTTGMTTGMFPVSQGDILKVTWSVVPTMTLIPR